MPAPASAQDDSSGRPASALVHPPRLIHFVDASYPPQALNRDQTARVVLRLDIDALGRVVDVRVAESAGATFDAAAAEAARGFIFTPAMRDGKPLAARILYHYVFEIDAEAATSDYLLTIVDRNTSKPLVGARAWVSQAGQQQSLTADADGRVQAEGLGAGSLWLRVEMPGYEPYEGNDTLKPAERKELRLALVPHPDEPSADGAIEVVVTGERHAQPQLVRRMKKRELERVPGTFGDALRALKGLPGVADTPTLSGLLVVRGTSAESTQVFFDGLYTPSVYHFGGLSSVVPTEMLESIDFRPGNFDVAFGRGIGGIVDAKIRSPTHDGKLHAMGQVDFIDARAMVEGPLPKSDGWRILAGARRSHLDTWLGPLLEGSNSRFSSLPVYYDYQVFLERESLQGDVIRIGLFGSDDEVRLLSDSNVFLNEFSQANAFWNIVSEYRTSFTPDTMWSHTSSFGRLVERIKVGPIESTTYAYPMVFRGQLTHRLTERLTLRTGPDILAAPFHIRFAVTEESLTRDPLAPSAVLEPPRLANSQSAFLQPGVYAALDVAATERLSLTPGLRLDYTQGTGRWDLSPRLNGTYALAADYPRTTLRFGAGVFREPPEVRFTLPEYGSSDLESLRALQYSLGATQDLTKQLELSAEGFYSDLDKQLSQGTQNGVTVLNNRGTGRSYGAEFMLRYQADEHFFGWASYTLSRSERRLYPGAPRELFPFDQTHIGSILGSYRLGKGWELGGRFRLVSGVPTQPCAQEIWDSSEGNFRCLASGSSQGREAWFHQLDVRAEKRWQLSERAAVSIYLDIINVYNRQTADLPFVPSLGLRGEL